MFKKGLTICFSQLFFLLKEQKKTKKNHILERLKTIKTIIELVNPLGCDPPQKTWMDGKYWNGLRGRKQIVPFLSFQPM